RLADAVHGRGVGVVAPHEALGAPATGAEAQLRGETVLELERQVVLMASAHEVHAVAHAPEEVERMIQLRHVLVTEHADRDELPEGLDLELDLRHPEGGVQVAQTAHALLELGLEQIDAVAHAGVALLALLQLLPEERGLVRGPDLLDDARLEVL